ncbi:MAG: serine hydrolase [Steroidobacteraceae bacterium]|jgi:D-alanyl-D-alanine endopeptidase (penicillin-binding protein 7)|nr:serine hydrolase [Steroidobacteraceae bacterium]
MQSWREIGLSVVAGVLLAGLMAQPAAGASPAPRSQPEVRSHAFYVLDEAGATVLAARHEHTPVPIASITKLMTALVVLDAGQPLDEVLTITRADLDGTVGGSSRIPLGARLTRSDMLRLALMSSENRSTHALCRNYPGGKPACVNAMNAKAADLGMRTARFVEPTGLSSRNVASPEDLAKLVLASGANPTISRYSTARDYTVVVKGQPLEYRNSNLLVKNPDWKVNVQKTGYISEAGRCLVMQTVIDGRDVVIVLLNSWGTLTRIADAKRIRSWMEQQVRRSAAAS